MGRGWRPRREGLGRALARSGTSPLSCLPTARPAFDQKPQRVSSPLRGFNDGNHVQVGKGDGNSANGFLKVLGGKKEFRQFLERRRKHTKKKGIKLSALREGLPGLSLQLETACSPLPGAAQVSPGEPTTFRMARPSTGSSARAAIWKPGPQLWASSPFEQF